MKITALEMERYEVNTMPFRWRDGLVGGAGGHGQVGLLRVRTDANIDGLVWPLHSAISEQLIHLCASMFIGADPLMRERCWMDLWERDRIEEFPIYFLGYLDAALWDIAAKAAEVPAYKLLGGHKSRAKAYASTVTMNTFDEYLRLADCCLAKGYKAIKLHVWGRVKDDIEPVKRMRQHVGPEIELMLDGSAGYTLDESIRMGRAMEEADYLWLEEPMREFNLFAYERICQTLDIPILGADRFLGPNAPMGPISTPQSGCATALAIG